MGDAGKQKKKGEEDGLCKRKLALAFCTFQKSAESSFQWEMFALCSVKHITIKHHIQRMNGPFRSAA